MEYQACSLPDCALGSEHAADDDHHAVLDGHAHHHH